MIQTSNFLNKLANALLLASLAFSNLGANASAKVISSLPVDAAQTQPALEFVPGVVLVGLKPGVSLAMGGVVVSDRHILTNSSKLGVMLKAQQILDLQPAFPDAQMTVLGAKNAQGGAASGLAQIYRLSLPASADVKVAVKSLASNPDLLFAEPDYIARAAEGETDTPTPTETVPVTLTETLTSTETETATPTETPTPAETATVTATVTETTTPTETPVTAATITEMIRLTETPALQATPTVTATGTTTRTATATVMLPLNAIPYVNDPLFSQQWGLSKINVDGAWETAIGSSTTIIAIIDSGIDLNHTDLVTKIWTNPGEIPGNGIDDDNNGYKDDVHGWNFVASNNIVEDDNGHGSLVAGIAAAVGNNGQGIIGVCPQCQLMPVKVMNSAGTANYSAIAAGVLYAAQKGAQVINLSVGGYADSNILRTAIETAANTYGVVIVAGAGNDNQDVPFYPAAYDSVLAVAGTQTDDTKVGTSNYAAWVDVSAPGADILSTALGSGWLSNSGTSFAAPFASGLAGLLVSQRPTWKQATIRSQIVYTAIDIDALNPATAGLLGSGRLDAGAAVLTPHPLISISAYNVNGLANGTPPLNVTSQMTITLSNDWWDALGVIATLSTTDTNVTMLNASASYGDILAATTEISPTPFKFSVKSAAGYNHPIPFKLVVQDTTGYVKTINFTVLTASGVVSKSGRISSNDTWTNNNTYLVTGTVILDPGVTLTIQPGTTVKFNGGFGLTVGGTLVADGTADQPIEFKSNTAAAWGSIQFGNPSTDALADGSGHYLSGSILRHVNITGTSSGIGCLTATPYLVHLNFSGSIACTLGATPIWFLDNIITGSASFTGPGAALRNVVSSGLSISGAGLAEDNIVTDTLSLGSGSARRNIAGGLTIGGSGGSLEDNTVFSNVNLGTSYTVTGNTIKGSLVAGDGATLDHNTVTKGITVGSSSSVTWNNVENNSTTGLSAGTNVTAKYNRLIGGTTGMTATTGLIEHNIIANNSGVGLQVGAATVRYNTFTGNKGNTIQVQGGNPLAIEYNNLEGNKGTYDLYANIASGVTVPAQNNWWGTTDTAVIDAHIYDYWDSNFTKAEVSFSLLLSAPNQTAPGYVRSISVLPDPTLGIETGTFNVQFSRAMDTTNYLQMSFAKAAGISWATRASMPTARYGLGVVAAKNGRIYAIGGADNVGNLFSTVEEYDPATNTWATRASMPTARNSLGVVAASNGKIYAIGGLDTTGGQTISTVEEYDPATNTWATRKNIPTARAYFGVVAASNGKIYAIGGLDNIFMVCATVEEYDPATNTWATRASMPTAIDSLGAVTASNGKVYAIGGEGIYEYDTATNTWATLASMPTLHYGLGVAAASNGKIYAIGGTNGQGLMASTVDEYDPARDTWVTLAGMPTARLSFGVAATSNGKIYAIGGVGGLSTVEEATVPIVTSGFYNPFWASGSVYRAYLDVTSLILNDTYNVNVTDAFDSDGMRMAPFSKSTFTVDYAGAITDKTPPLKPVVTASGNGSLTTLSANWSSSDPESAITGYRYAIGTSPGTRDVAAWRYLPSSTTSVARTGLKLTAGRTYYVSVGARNVGGLWSADGISNGVKAGVAAPGAFNKSVPAVYSLTKTNPTLTWGASSGAATYEYCTSKVSAAACTTWTANGSALSKAFSGLTPGTTYYWHVRARNLGGLTYASGSPSAFWSFTTESLPGTFAKINPPNGVTSKPLTTLSWAASPGAATYEVCYSKINAAACTVWSLNGAATSKVLSGLTPGARYYWQVRARNGAGVTYANGLSTAFWSFVVNASAPPRVVSINRADANPSTAASTRFTVTFSEAVTGVDTADFSLTTTGLTGVGVTLVAGSGATRTVTVKTGTGSGTLRLNVIDNDTIRNTALVRLGGTGAGNGTFLLGQKYTLDRNNTFMSIASQDGWALETAKASGLGGTLGQGGTLFVGDDAANKQYRSILSFDTSLLPDNATIVKVTLKIMKAGLVGVDPFTTHGSLLADLQKGFFGTSVLQPTDFQAIATRASVGAFAPVAGTPGWYQMAMSKAHFPAINLTGATQFRLRFSASNNNDNNVDYLTFYAGEAGSTSLRPVLVVEYTLP